MSIKLEPEPDTLLNPEQLKQDLMDIKLQGEPNTELSPMEVKKALQEEGSDNELLQKSFMGADMVDSVGEGTPGYQTTGEADGFGYGALQEETSGVVEVSDEQQYEDEIDAPAPTPSPFRKRPY
ncbi:hypothetical protein [Legionella oakridgensis]|uniref:Uncharacterized protein n=2 Tax=Legionella oakridgensis TaxID=29423 RepID=W0B6L1_9GAMM|nr:hypothetical protein [Legionella oakridgensis]AHE66183.1 hypothetical protein Loa_00613 [Legionella oakridgensis ATCC 33761 = DSM 21215]ETO94045.1 hypothetical protein LOR_52c10450 [Legionella oakridgensis RV-2-2007]KTD37292.1 hypothetical protein Loak_2428 [Legionella oakridgensis]STY16091.1 Uncharacterised protein [Legionella longbeachae]